MTEGSGTVSSHSTISNDPASSSRSSSLGSSARSARPLFGLNNLPKLPNTLFVGRPSGRNPYVGSKFSISGKDVSGGSGAGGGRGFEGLAVAERLPTLETESAEDEWAR